MTDHFLRLHRSLHCYPIFHFSIQPVSMVDVNTPANGTADGTPDQAESSREGLRRMQRLSEAARVKPNPYVSHSALLTEATLPRSTRPPRRWYTHQRRRGGTTS